MGFRFQKRIKVGKFLTFNLSRKGVSTSIGVTGARVTYGHGQKRTTLGLEGTGLSHTSIKKTGEPLRSEPLRSEPLCLVEKAINWLFALLCFFCVTFTVILATISFN